MRKRGMIVAAGMAAMLVLSLAPSASALHEFGEVTVIQAPATPLADGVLVPAGGDDGDVTILSFAFDAAHFAQAGRGSGDVTALPGSLVETVPAPGGAAGTVAVLSPLLGHGVFAPRGSGAGDVTVEQPLAPTIPLLNLEAAATDAGVQESVAGTLTSVTSLLVRGGIG